MNRTDLLTIGTVSLLTCGPGAQEPYRVAVSSTPSSFFEVNALRDHATNHSQSYCAFSTPAGGDSLFEFGWFYRVAGDPRNYAFNDDPGNAQALVTPSTYDFGPPATGLEVGSMVLDWTDVDGRGFDASWQVAVAELASDRATAMHTLSLTNPSAAPLTIEIFLYLDIDTDGGAGDTDLRANFNDRFVVRDQSTDHFVDVDVDPAPSAYEVDEFFSDLDGRIMGGTAYDLQNSGFPFSAGDWTGALQWSLTIDPAATVDVEVTLGRNVCPNPFGVLAAVSNYGTPVPGALGPPRVSSTAPIVGNRFDILIGNGPSNGTATLMIGDIPQEIPYCGITLYLNPWTSLPIPLDPVGSGSVPMLTQCAPELYGVTLLAQAFTIDLGSTSPCFPIAHSDRCEMLLGD